MFHNYYGRLPDASKVLSSLEGDLDNEWSPEMKFNPYESVICSPFTNFLSTPTDPVNSIENLNPSYISSPTDLVNVMATNNITRMSQLQKKLMMQTLLVSQQIQRLESVNKSTLGEDEPSIVDPENQLNKIRELERLVTYLRRGSSSFYPQQFIGAVQQFVEIPQEMSTQAFQAKDVKEPRVIGNDLKSPWNVELPHDHLEALESASDLPQTGVSHLPSAQTETLKEEQEKPYVCPIPECAQRFKHVSNWRHHRFVHSKTKPFPCPVSKCTREYARIANMKNHLRVKHNLAFRPKVCPNNKDVL